MQAESRNRKKRAYGCTEWMISVPGKRNTHIRWQKYRRLLGYLKHYLEKPLARKEERPLKVDG